MTGAEAAAAFRAMADRIERADVAEFGGAYLIAPPDGGGEPVDGLAISATPKPASFWATLSGEIDVAVATLKANEEMKRGRGW